MRTIAVSSQKGGVGKTTVAINLAHAFARAGMRTLLVDSDPQGSVGLSLTRQSRLLSGFYDYLADPGMPLDRMLVPTRLETFTLVAAGQGGEPPTHRLAMISRVLPRACRGNPPKPLGPLVKRFGGGGIFLFSGLPDRVGPFSLPATL